MTVAMIAAKHSRDTILGLLDRLPGPHQVALDAAVVTATGPLALFLLICGVAGVTISMWESVCVRQPRSSGEQRDDEQATGAGDASPQLTRR